MKRQMKISTLESYADIEHLVFDINLVSVVVNVVYEGCHLSLDKVIPALWRRQQSSPIDIFKPDTAQSYGNSMCLDCLAM